MKKYKIYFEQDDIKLVEILISRDDNGYFINNRIKIKNENFMFNFKSSTVGALLDVIKIRLGKFGNVEIVETE